jgi:hypothetical protein
MKRDMELIREILLMIESNKHGFASQKIEIPGYTQEQIGYHAVLLGEAGLVKVHDITCMESDSPVGMISRLTWEGHEFLDSARDNNRWNQAKDMIDKVSSVSMSVLTALLTELAKKSLNI